MHAPTRCAYPFTINSSHEISIYEWIQKGRRRGLLQYVHGGTKMNKKSMLIRRPNYSNKKNFSKSLSHFVMGIFGII